MDGVQEEFRGSGFLTCIRCEKLMGIDDIVTKLYRRFKDWSKRGFGPDDVTWCEVKADVLDIIKASTHSRPSTAEAVAVKALEWTEILDKNKEYCGDEADTPIGMYNIGIDPFSYCPVTAYYVDGPADFHRLQVDTVEAAKAAAQADYETRIRSALTHPSPQGGEEPTPTPNSRATQYPNVPLGETGGTDELVERLNGTAFNDPEAWRAALLAEAASSLAAEKLKTAELERSILTFRGEVTDEMVDRACRANIHPDTEPSDVERRKMRRSLEAANICESCASVADHLQDNVGERETIRVEALEEVAGLAIPAYSYDVAGVRTGIERFRKQLQAYAAKARAALASEA